MSLAEDSVHWATALAIAAPVIVMIINTIETRRTRKDMARLEQNTNSKMDALLEAKDAAADARVGEASALGEELGRTKEAARQEGIVL